MSKKKQTKKSGKSKGFAKAFFVSILISVLFILAVSLVVLLFLYPRELMTNEHLYDICVNLVLFFSVVFVLSVAAIWITSTDLKAVEEKDEINLYDNCDYSYSMTDDNLYGFEDEKFIGELQPLSEKENASWEIYEEYFSANPEKIREKYVAELETDSDNSCLKVFTSDEYKYNFDKPSQAVGIVLETRNYIPFPEKNVRPFPWEYDESKGYRPKFNTEPVLDQNGDVMLSENAMHDTLSTLLDELGRDIDNDYVAEDDSADKDIDDSFDKEDYFDRDDDEYKLNFDDSKLTSDDELRLPLDEDDLSNDGFDNVVPYIQPVYDEVPFIFYEELIKDEKIINSRPLVIDINGVIPFKYIRERMETDDKAVVLGFKAPKATIDKKVVMNFSVNSDDALLGRKDGIVIPFLFHSDVLADVIDNYVVRDDSIKSNGTVPFRFLEYSEKVDESLLKFNIENTERNERKLEILDENVMDYLLEPENVFSKSTQISSNDVSKDDSASEYKGPKVKWWNDFVFIPGVKREDDKKKPVLDYNISSDDADINKKSSDTLPFNFYEDLLLDIKEINRRDDSIQSSGIIPFKFSERKDVKDEAVSLFEAKSQPAPEQHIEAKVEETVKYPQEEEKEIIRINPDNPNNPHYAELGDIYSVKIPLDESLRSKENKEDVYLGPSEKWWDDFIYIKGIQRNPNDPSYETMSLANDIPLQPYGSQEEFLSDDDIENAKEKEKWWDDFEFIPGFDKKSKPVLNYNINSDDADILAKTAPLFPFTYYEDLLNDEKEVIERGDVHPEGLVPFVFLEAVEEEPSSPITLSSSREENPNNIPYSNLFNSENIEGKKEDEELEQFFNPVNKTPEKWWEDFVFNPGVEKILVPNPLNKYYNQLFSIDDYDIYKDYFKAEEDSETDEIEPNRDLEKWWEDFVFIPGFAKEEPKEEIKEDIEDEVAQDSQEPLNEETGEKRIISLIEEEMASSLDIDYPLTIARIDSDKIDQIFALDYVDVVTFRLSKTSACLVFIALDKKESMDVINTIKANVDKNLKYKMSELSGRKIDKKSFLAEVSA